MTDYTDILTRLDNKAELNLMLNKEAAEAIRQLVAERDAAFAMSRCECESNEACANLVKLHDEVERLKQERDAALDEIDELARKAREGTAQAIRQANEITTLKSALREAKH